MKKRKLSERQVATLTGVPYSTVHDVKSGIIPRLDTAVSLADGLHIDIKELYVYL